MLATAVVLAGIAAGCGYSFQESGRPMGAQFNSLAIPLVESSSSNLGFEADFTEALRTEFISHSQVPLVPRERAEMVLLGRVHEIWTEPFSYSLRKVEVNGEERTYPVTNTRWLKLKMDVKLVENASGRVLWERTGLEEKATFRVDNDPLSNQYNERQALQDIARRMAERVFQQTMERF